MFAVIRTGGKQYKVAKGDVLDIERLPGDAGAAVTFSEVLMAGGKAGAPLVKGASVAAEIVAQERKKSERLSADQQMMFDSARRIIGMSGASGSWRYNTSGRRYEWVPGR